MNNKKVLFVKSPDNKYVHINLGYKTLTIKLNELSSFLKNDREDIKGFDIIID